MDYKKTMLELQEELRQRIAKSLEEQRLYLSNKNTEEVDQIQEKSSAEFATRMVERDNKRLKQVEEALRLIDKGQYGQCMGCGCDIPTKRLLAVPLATCCVDCQEDND